MLGVSGVVVGGRELAIVLAVLGTRALLRQVSGKRRKEGATLSKHATRRR